MRLRLLNVITELGLEKRAATMVRKTRMVEEHDDHCPHCDHQFTEKGYPRPRYPEGATAEQRSEIYRSGDYDEHCPNCGGIVDDRESDPEQYAGFLSGWSGLKEQMDARRETKRKRIAAREKSAGFGFDQEWYDKLNKAIDDHVAGLPDGEEKTEVSKHHGTFKGSCGHTVRQSRCGCGVHNQRYHPNVTLPLLCQECEGQEKQAKTSFSQALHDSSLPGYITFFTDGKERCTISFNDGDEKETITKAEALVRKHFKNYEEADDSEIGCPSWATESFTGSGKRHSIHKRESVGVDFDGTLATTLDKFHPKATGKPIGPMVERIKKHLADGDRVRIFTARAHNGGDVSAVKAWSLKHLGQELGVTCEKDPHMTILYDDKAVSVRPDTGIMKRADGPVDRLMQREGGDVTDSGGLTRFGHSVTSGMSPAAIKALTPDTAKALWQKRYDALSSIQDKGVREVVFDQQANTWEQGANRTLQDSLNRLDPNHPLPKDGLLGKQTLQATNAADPSALTNDLMVRFKNHHEQLARDNPQKFGQYARGWASRRKQLWESPDVIKHFPVAGPPASGMPIPFVGPPASAAGGPIQVHGTPPANATIVPQTIGEKYFQGGPLPLASQSPMVKQQAVRHELQEAKALSEAGRYGAKHQLLKRLIAGDPTSFVVDQPDAKYPGITHTPTGFKLHASKEVADAVEHTKAASHYKALAKARRDTNTKPTDNQKTSGVDAKGTLKWKGLTIKIENPKGSVRSGVSKTGEKWARTTHADYGYFKGTEARDGDEVDTFVGPDLDSEFVAVIDQYDGKRFDESKVILGYHNKAEAAKLYSKHYPAGWVVGPTSSTTVHGLKDWLRNGDTKKPFKGQLVKAAKLLALVAELS